MNWGVFKTLKNIVSIDPGGYELGLARFEEGVLKSTETLYRDEDESRDRRASFYRHLVPILASADMVICEEPFIRGVGNTNMQRMLGVFELAAGDKLHLINPMTVKKQMGSGSFDKLQVANAVKNFLSEPEKKIVDQIIDKARWNESDAVAVAIAWISKTLMEGIMAKKTKKSTMKNKSGNKSAKVGKSGMGKSNQPLKGGSAGKGYGC